MCLESLLGGVQSKIAGKPTHRRREVLRPTSHGKEVAAGGNGMMGKTSCFGASPAPRVICGIRISLLPCRKWKAIHCRAVEPKKWIFEGY